MAKKIIGGVGSLLGLKKKKKAAEPTPAQTPAENKRWTPIIKQLGSANPSPASVIARARAGRGGFATGTLSTVLNDKLG